MTTGDSLNSKDLSKLGTSGQKQRKNLSRDCRDSICLKKFILSKHSNSMEPQVVTEVDKSSAMDSGETKCRELPKTDFVESCQAVQDKLASFPMGNLNTNIAWHWKNQFPQPNLGYSGQLLLLRIDHLFLPRTTLLLYGKKITWSHST